MSSNDLTQVRDYIKTRIESVFPDYSEWKASLSEIGNIPQTRLDETYHITLGVNSSSQKIDRHIEDSFSVTVTTFKRGFNQSVEARDSALQASNCIRLDVINPDNVEAYKAANDGNIESVEAITMEPSEIEESNDNIIKIELELNVRLFFGI